MITRTSPSIQISQDKKTGRSYLTVQQPNGDADAPKLLTEADRRKIMGAAALMAKGYVTAALGIFSQVSADLATAVSVESKQNVEMAKANNAIGHDLATEHAQQTSADASMMNARTNAARASREKAADRQIPPDMLAKYNDLAGQLAVEQDPTKRKQLITQINVMETQIANVLGKPRVIPAEKGAGEIPEEVIRKQADAMVGTPTCSTVNGKPEVYTPATAYPAARAIVRGLNSGASDGFTPPPTATPAAAAAAARGAPANPAAAPAPAAGLPTRSSAGRVEELRAALAKDDRIKSGGLAGMGGRAIQEGALPMGLAERRSAEEELARLTK
jgi:hypothetical protein